MWSIGCIFAELITLQPLISGSSGFGNTYNTTFPGYSELPVGKITFKNHPTDRLRETISNLLSDDGLSLLQGFLIIDQVRRVTTDAALNHPYFEEEPVAMELAMFLHHCDQILLNSTQPLILERRGRAVRTEGQNMQRKP
ncbi:cyclin-dependent kinase 11B-like [Spodoptera frugiperda]|uniref:Cyclin-dependent kinase 11B-like n=1 Tax=Spodoptera frugiperda TaxID=7108 RepID=A0A9R0DTC8_SPOFR|nr:cyclin-dependent kinase 11B-like [Spodoptera frugiperda]